MLSYFSLFFDWKKNKLFDYVSKRTMSVFLFHQQIIYIVVNLLNGLINPYLHVLINFLVSFFTSIIIANICYKSKVTRIIIGEAK